MKDFNEFIKTIKDEHYTNSQKAINKLEMKISFPLSYENSSELADAIVVMSTVCAVELLAKYHIWRNNPA